MKPGRGQVEAVAARVLSDLDALVARLGASTSSALAAEAPKPARRRRTPLRAAPVATKKAR